MTNLSGMQGNTIQGVYYLRITNEKYNDKFSQKAEWVPLKFTDTTKVEKMYRDSNVKDYTTKSSSLVQSGYIIFDMPSDWSQTSIQDLCGGFFSMSGQALASTQISTDYSKKLTSLDNLGNISASPNPSVVFLGSFCRNSFS